MGTYITENFSHATKKEHIAKKFCQTIATLIFVLFNRLNAIVALIQKPVNWFAVQMNWLVSIWGQQWHLIG